MLAAKAAEMRGEVTACAELLNITSGYGDCTTQSLFFQGYDIASVEADQRRGDG
jgi:hypothetical protein